MITRLINSIKWRILGLRSGSPPGYDADGLKVWGKNTAFLSDSRFIAAYNLGMNSGHKIARPAGSQIDIHIEWRVYVICWAAQHATHLNGDFVECGVNTGICSLAAMEYTKFNTTGKKFYLFDTYNGIPEEQMSVAEKNKGIRNINKAFYEDCFEVTKRNFAPYPNAILVRGRIPDTLATTSVAEVCYLAIDMNIVAPEIAAIRHFWPKLVPGACVILDDYGWSANQPQKEAMDAFARDVSCEILTLPTGQGLMLKPPR